MPAPSTQLSQAVATNVVASVSTSATGAFLSAAVDLTDYEGLVAVVLNTGTITGSIAVPTIKSSATSGGTYADIATNGAFVATAATTSVVTFSASESLPFIKFSSNVTTGPVVWSVTVIGFKKYR